MATIKGTNSKNVLKGTKGIDTLFGRGGNDTLLGLDSDDRLFGENGNDRLDGGRGRDRMDGGRGNDVYVVDNSKDVVTEAGKAGTDTVLSSVTYTLPKNVENLTLTGKANVNGTGNTLGNVIKGNIAVNTLSGGDGNDSIEGGSGKDKLLGGDGSDSLDGGTSADRMEGGAGNDVYVVDRLGDKVIEAAGKGTDTIQTKIGLAAIPANVEIVQIIGGGPIVGASIDLTGNDGANRLIGNNDSNVLDGVGGDDTLNGAGGDDSLIGGEGDDSLIGGSGDDTLDGSDGADVMVGGSGSDVIIVDNAGDRAAGAESAILIPAGLTAIGAAITAQASQNGAGGDIDEIRSATVDLDLATLAPEDDFEIAQLTGALNLNVFGDAASANGITIIGNAGNNRLIGQNGNDTLDGRTGADSLVGGEGNDTVDGGAGADSLVGGTGDDTYVVEASGDVVVENAEEGQDTLVFSTDTVTDPDVDLNDFPNVENVTVLGDEAINVIGDANDNVLVCTEGANSILGNDGNDSLDGGKGDDSLVGGNGDDIFVYSLGYNDDVIIDGSGDELLRFRFDDITANIVRDGDDALFTNIDGSTLRVVDQFTAGTVETVEQIIDQRAIPFFNAFQIGTTDSLGSDILVGDDTGETFTLRGSDFRFDAVYANGGDDVITSNGLLQIGVNPGTGNDTITGSVNFNDYLIYLDRADAMTIDFDAGIVNIGGGAEIDTFALIEGFYGGSGDDVFLGTDDTNLFPFFGGGPGDDTYTGGAAEDYVDYFFALEGVTVDLAAGTGGGGFTTSTGNDTLTGVEDVGGSLFADNLLGSAGANFIQGYRGDDDLFGRGGDDIYAYNFGDGNDTIVDSSGVDDLNYRNFERFDLNWFQSGSDLVQQSIDGSTIRIFDHYVDKQLETVVGFYRILVGSNVEGGLDGDLIVGTSGKDTLIGGGGEDRIYAGAGNDVIIVGEDGNAFDFVVPGRGNDTITGTQFDTDEISYMEAPVAAVFDMTAGTVTLGTEVDTFSGIDDFYGTPFDDTFSGTSDAGDFFFWEGGPGNDTFTGGDSEEEVAYFFALEGVTVDLAAGTATGGASVGTDFFTNIEDAFGSAFSDTLLGNSGNNFLTGGSRGLGDSDDFIDGKLGNDVLSGRDGDDTLIGDAGEDRLRGDRGEDVMTGGADADFFQYGRNTNGVEDIGTVTSNVTAAAAGVVGDTITDFASGTDLLQFFQGDFSPSGILGVLTEFVNFSTIAASYDGTNQGTNSEADALRESWIFSSTDLTLYYDANGDGAGYSVVATIQGGGTITANDVEIIV